MVYEFETMSVLCDVGLQFARAEMVDYMDMWHSHERQKNVTNLETGRRRAPSPSQLS